MNVSRSTRSWNSTAAAVGLTVAAVIILVVAILAARGPGVPAGAPAPFSVSDEHDGITTGGDQDPADPAAPTGPE